MARVDIDAGTVALLAVVSTGLAAAALVAAAVLALRVRVLGRRLLGPGAGRGGVRPVGSAPGAAGLVHADLADVRADLDGLRLAQRSALGRVALVRYDAFPQMGGMQSFSAALLDADGSGLVLTTINGRQESRSYAKPVVAGRSEHSLSEEEQDALRAAVEQPTVRPAAARRRRRRA